MTRHSSSVHFCLALLVAGAISSACQSKPAPPKERPDAGAGWARESQTRHAQVEKVIADSAANYEAFDSGSLGDATLEMIPYVVFRAMQELEPAAFGDAALESTGFFARPDAPSGHNGVAWTRPVAPDKTVALRYMTRTCASCHTGRVRLADGSTRLLHGGANTEINLHRFIGRLTSTLKPLLAASNDTPECQAFKKRILGVLASKPPDWYWGAGSKAVPPEDAAKEVAAVTANIDAVLARMRAMNERRLGGFALLQSHSYAHAQNPPSLVDGAPGLVETSGLGSAALVPAVGVDKADLVLPPGPSKADIPAVWSIDPTGYANWDGTVRGFARSLTSSLAVVGDPAKIDFAANALIQRFLGQLPPEPYPFAIDDAARARGEATFKTNCAGCHATASGRARNDLVFDVGSDPLRAQAIRPVAVMAMAKLILATCPATIAECKFDSEGPVVDPSARRFYVASPLHGIWAQAPYLHNGSVPTLRQLLVPSSRTAEPFLRGSIAYVQKDGGWEWEPSKESELRQRGDVAVALHDIRQTGYSNVGHGSAAQPMVTDGKGASVRIAWSDSAADRAVVDDLISYLLTL
jgi:mono/diheme cytochrome c family protein